MKCPFWGIFIIGFLLLFSYVWATKFYKPPVCRKLENLTPEQVERIIFYAPTNEKAELTDEESAEIIALWNKMDIRGFCDEDFENYFGAWTDCMFYVELTDGSTVKFATNILYYIVDGLLYEADYDVSYEIQDLYNKFRKEKEE